MINPTAPLRLCNGSLNFPLDFCVWLIASAAVSRRYSSARGKRPRDRKLRRRRSSGETRRKPTMGGERRIGAFAALRRRPPSKHLCKSAGCNRNGSFANAPDHSPKRQAHVGEICPVVFYFPTRISLNSLLCYTQL